MADVTGALGGASGTGQCVLSAPAVDARAAVLLCRHLLTTRKSPLGKADARADAEPRGPGGGLAELPGRLCPVPCRASGGLLARQARLTWIPLLAAETS